MINQKENKNLVQMLRHLDTAIGDVHQLNTDLTEDQLKELTGKLKQLADKIAEIINQILAKNLTQPELNDIYNKISEAKNLIPLSSISEKSHNAERSIWSILEKIIVACQPELSIEYDIQLMLNNIYTPEELEALMTAEAPEEDKIRQQKLLLIFEKAETLITKQPLVKNNTDMHKRVQDILDHVRPILHDPQKTLAEKVSYTMGLTALAIFFTAEAKDVNSLLQKGMAMSAYAVTKLDPPREEEEANKHRDFSLKIMESLAIIAMVANIISGVVSFGIGIVVTWIAACFFCGGADFFGAKPAVTDNNADNQEKIWENIHNTINKINTINTQTTPGCREQLVNLRETLNQQSTGTTDEEPPSSDNTI